MNKGERGMERGATSSWGRSVGGITDLRPVIIIYYVSCWLPTSPPLFHTLALTCGRKKMLLPIARWRLGHLSCACERAVKCASEMTEGG